MKSGYAHLAGHDQICTRPLICATPEFIYSWWFHHVATFLTSIIFVMKIISLLTVNDAALDLSHPGGWAASAGNSVSAQAAEWAQSQQDIGRTGGDVSQW